MAGFAVCYALYSADFTINTSGKLPEYRSNTPSMRPCYKAIRVRLHF